MSKAQSKSKDKASSSASKSSGASDRNIAAGGQVYDRTTGTWEGSTQGSFGDGKDRGEGLNTKVWRDANGITGVEVIGPRSASPASGNGGGGSGSSRAGQSGGAGPASARVTAGGVGAGGAGPGSAMVTMGNRGAFLGQIATALPFDDPSPIIPLYVGGRALAHDQGWSSIADWEERTGDSEFLSPTWFASWGVASADAWANMGSQNGGPLHTQKIQHDLYEAPGQFGQGAREFGSYLADYIRASKDPFGPEKPLKGFSSGGF